MKIGKRFQIDWGRNNLNNFYGEIRGFVDRKVIVKHIPSTPDKWYVERYHMEDKSWLEHLERIDVLRWID